MTEFLERSLSWSVRDDDGRAMPTLFGHFAVFNRWTEIDSPAEGHFMERVVPGAFRGTFERDRSKFRVLFNHGQDPQIGAKPIASITELREDGHGAYYEAHLLDAPYVRDLLPALRAGQLGASFRFSVESDSVNTRPERSTHNPRRLPERTLTAVRLREFGPVTFGAYTDATAGVRTDTFDPSDPARLRELLAALS